MNENAEDDEAMPSGSAKLLSGNSLLQIHINAGKSLPKDGLKDFAPKDSWMEKKQVQTALDERKELLEEERVEKWGCLATALWDQKKMVAEVTRRTGKHFQTLGFEKEGTLYLYPEEALYLLETNSLELTFGGIPVSIQQGYSLLLGSNSGCNLIEYRTYSHLLRQGYRLLRFSNQKLHTKYERMIRLDQHVPGKHSHPAASVINHSQSKSKNSKNICTIKTEAHLEKDSVEDFIKQEKEENRRCHVKHNECIGYEVENLEGSAVDQVEGDAHLLKKEHKESQEPAAKEKIGEIKENRRCHVKHNECIGYEVENLEGSAVDQVEGDAHLLKKEHKESQEPAAKEKIGEITNERLCQENLGTEDTAANSKAAGNRKNLENPEVSQGNAKNDEQLLEQPGQVHDAMQICGAGIKNRADNDQLKNNSESNSKLSKTHDNCTRDVEGAQTKAYGIAESLLTLGNVLIGKDTSDSGGESKDRDLSVTLQTEIMKILGAHVGSDVSKEALIAVASSTATTILSHMSENQDGGKDNDKKLLDSKIVESEEDNSHHDSGENSVLGSSEKTIESSNEISESRGELALSSTNTKLIATEKNPAHSFNKDVNTMDCSTEPLPPKLNTVSEKSDCSQALKRPASASEGRDEYEPVMIKRAKAENVPDAEIEIIDASPEARLVELVNLSDESSMEYIADNDTNDGIEVIDVDDSSSSSKCNKSDDSSSESDNSVIECNDESADYWDSDRKNILETIPNMYRLTEISLTPPSSDLLPTNVQPQRNRYIISRTRLLEERREAIPAPYVGSSWQQHADTLYEESREGNTRPYVDWPPPRQRQNMRHMTQQPLPTFNFDSPDCHPQQVWQPNVPINPVAAVQAIAQLVLPMLGLSQASYQADQMWMPNNSLFPPQTAWGPRHGPRFNQQPLRGNNWQRPYRSRPYGFRPRYNHHRRGYNHYSANNQRGAPSGSNLVVLTRNNEGVPYQSTSNDHRDRSMDSSLEQNQPRCWMQQHIPRRRGRGRRPYTGPKRRSRYYSHLHKFLSEENCEVLSVKSDESCVSSEPNNSPSIKPESYSSDEGNNSVTENAKNYNLNENSNSSLQEGSQSTDGSCNSSLEVKPLLSPSDCTSFENVFKTIQITQQADTETLLSTACSKLLKPQFDLFSPNKPFKKGNPPLPDFHLCIMDNKDSVPGPGEIRALFAALDDKVPIMFAVVSPDSISFIELSDVSLPSV